MASTDTPVNVQLNREQLEAITLDTCFEVYQKACFDLAVYPDAGHCNHVEWLYLAAKFSGEAGETSDLLGKMYRKGYTLPKDVDDEMIDKLVEELGDVMWYFGQICRVFDLEFSHILTKNKNKLLQRQATGELKERKPTSNSEPLYAVMTREISTPGVWSGIAGPTHDILDLLTQAAASKLDSNCYMVQLRDPSISDPPVSLARWSPKINTWIWDEGAWARIEEGETR